MRGRDCRRRSRRPGDRNLHAKTQSGTVRRASRGREKAWRQDPRQRRIALQPHQHGRHRTRFLGRPIDHRSARASRISGPRDDRLLPRAWRPRARRGRRQAVSRQQPGARSTGRAARGNRSRRRHAADGATGPRHRAGRRRLSAHDQQRQSSCEGRRACDRRPVPSQERKRRHRLRPRPTARPHHRAADACARAARPGRHVFTADSPASRRTSSSRSGSTARSGPG